MSKFNSLKKLSGNIYLDSFINDYKPKKIKGKVCIDGTCEFTDDEENLPIITGEEKVCFSESFEDDHSPDDQFKRLKDEVAKELFNKNISFGIDGTSATTFFMTKNRSRASKTMRNILLSQPDKSKLLELASREDGSKDIIMKLKNKSEIYLGYKKEVDSTKLIVPNCALLMAQHYFELFMWVYEKKPQCKEFWIFDFLVQSEAKEVKNGAIASRFLFDWPKDITVHIINCSYEDDGTGYLQILDPLKF